MVYYNEFDKQKAAWLRELIKCNAIAPGDVDERSIRDVQPNDLKPYKQCHFFAGIGVWSYALRLAGWDDERSVWTGSCPCQPFSAAGRRQGVSDERHLWPELFRLIARCRPVTVVGEQVASKDGLAWLDDVLTDLENEDYSAGAVDTCAAGFGAPHIRQRLYWSGLSNTPGTRLEGAIGARLQGYCDRPPYTSNAIRVSNAQNHEIDGHWTAAEWLRYGDGKARPIEPGTFPLAHGAPARVVTVCSDCETETRFKVNGSPDEAVSPEAVRIMRGDDDAPSRRKWLDVEASEILLAAMLRGFASEDSDDGRERQKAGMVSAQAEGMFALRIDAEHSASPCGPEPYQQLQGQYRRALREVPSRGTLDTSAKVKMRSLLEVFCGRIAQEPEQNLFCGVCAGVRPHQCAKEMGSRVIELRGYGDAIVASQAAEFIKALMDVVG